jgi:head-tail adaptor
MAKRSGAGSLNCQVTFQTREMVEDEYGNTTAGQWVSQLTTSARLMPIFSSKLNVEAVAEARLQSKQPYNLTIRSITATRQISAVGWRVYDARAGIDLSGNPKRVFDIKTIVNPDEKNAYLEMLLVEGEAS